MLWLNIKSTYPNEDISSHSWLTSSLCQGQAGLALEQGGEEQGGEKEEV